MQSHDASRVCRSYCKKKKEHVELAYYDNNSICDTCRKKKQAEKKAICESLQKEIEKSVRTRAKIDDFETLQSSEGCQKSETGIEYYLKSIRNLNDARLCFHAVNFLNLYRCYSTIQESFVSVYHVERLSKRLDVYLESMDGNGLQLAKAQGLDMVNVPSENESGELSNIKIEDYHDQLNSCWDILIDGLDLLHSKKHFFSDIKPENIGFNITNNKITLKWIDIDCISECVQQCESLPYYDPYTSKKNKSEITGEIARGMEFFKVGLSIFEMLTGEHLIAQAWKEGKDEIEYIESKRNEMSKSIQEDDPESSFYHKFTENAELLTKIYNFLSPCVYCRIDVVSKIRNNVVTEKNKLLMKKNLMKKNVLLSEHKKKVEAYQKEVEEYRIRLKELENTTHIFTFRKCIHTSEG